MRFLEIPMRLKYLALAAIAVTLSSMLVATGANAAKTDSCAHCHGTDGNSTGSAYPSLAGQTKEYIARQIKSFKEGLRKDPMMSPAAAVLADQDIQDVAEYFSTQTIVRGTFKSDPAVVAEGKKIADELQCVTCHQPGYKGLNEFPRLARQRQPYLVKQLKDFRDGKRTNDNGVMSVTAQKLTDEQIQALAQYLTGL
jgi:cytochrome c553